MRALVAVTLIATLTASASAEKTSQAEKNADELFAEGKRLLAKKEYARACAAFEQSFKIDPAIGTQLNLGLCNEKWGRWPDAYRAYAEAARLAREADDDRFSHIRQQLERAARNVGRVVVKLPADADPRIRLRVDDMPIDPAAEEVPLKPGSYTLVAEIPGRPHVVRKLELSAGAREVVELTDVPRRDPEQVKVTPAKPAPDDRDDRKVTMDNTAGAQANGEGGTASDASAPSGRRRGRLIGGVSLTVGGTAAIGIASYLALDARSRYNAAEPLCPGGMCSTPEAHAETTAARARARQMTFVFAGGLALASVGTYLIVTSRRPRAKDAGVETSLLITDREAMLVVGGRL